MKALVVGAGSIGRRHLRNLRSLDVNALGIVDVDRARSTAAARECDATVYATLEEALASAPDFALIATPTHLHLRPALACARAGVHVLIEKPLAATGGEISALVEEVAARRLHAMVACNLRFDDVYMRVQRALDEVALGRVYAAQFYFGYDLSAWRPGVDYRNVYSAWRDQGGGITLDGIHELDLALYWFGQPRRILSLPRRTGMLAGDAEDVLDLIVEFRTGVVASLHLNYLDPVYRRTVSVAGDQAVVEGDFARRQVAVRGRHAVVTTDNFPDDRNAMYVRQLEYFLGVVRGEARPPATLTDGIRALELALVARDRGPVVEVDRGERPLDRVTAVIQARLGSRRLPGKVLMTAAGKPFLELLVERIRRAKRIDQIILATTEAPADRALVDEARRLRLAWFTGSEEDVLARYVGVARRYDLPVVARISADCPLLDPDTIDSTVGRFLMARPDYLSNAYPERSVPDGFDVEVLSRAALERAHREATDRDDRENVTRFIYRHPERFEVLSAAPFNGQLARRRLALDTVADYELIKSVFERLYPMRPDFSLSDVLGVLEGCQEIDTTPRRSF